MPSHEEDDMSDKTKDQPKAEEEPELDDETSEEEEDDDAEEEDAEGDSEAGDDEEDAEEEDEEDGDDEEDEEDSDDEEDEEEDAHHGGKQEAASQGDEEDPYWWTPHVVLAVLVLIGLLGFFGIFNKTLGFLAAKPQGMPVETATAHTETTPQPAKPQQPQQPQQAQQPQPPREMFGAKHFLVMYKGGMRAPASVTRTKEEAKARAEEGLKKVKGGKKFEEVVGEYSDEPGAGARGGDLGLFPKGAMVGAFQEAVEKLKVNEISDLVETPFGYHVILRTK